MVLRHIVKTIIGNSTLWYTINQNSWYLIAGIRTNRKVLPVPIGHRNGSWWRDCPTFPCWCSDGKCFGGKFCINGMICKNAGKCVGAYWTFPASIYVNSVYIIVLAGWDGKRLACTTRYCNCAGWWDCTTGFCWSSNGIGWRWYWHAAYKACCNCMICCYIVKRVGGNCTYRCAVNHNTRYCISGAGGNEEGLACSCWLIHSAWRWDSTSCSRRCCDVIVGWACASLVYCEQLACNSRCSSSCSGTGIGRYRIGCCTITGTLVSRCDGNPRRSAAGYPGATGLGGDLDCPCCPLLCNRCWRWWDGIRAGPMVYLHRICAFNVWRVVCCCSKIIYVSICESSYRIRIDLPHVNKHGIISGGVSVIDSVSCKVTLSVGIPGESDLGRHYRHCKKKNN